MKKGELTTGNVIQEITLKYKPRKITERRVDSSEAAYKVILQFYDKDTINLYESLLVFFVNSSLNITSYMRHSQGGMTETTVDPRLIIATALKCGAMGIILTHNHPGGNIKPSNSDDNFTQNIARGCRYMNLMLLDHLIVSEDSYFSYTDNNRINNTENVRI